MRRSGKGTDDAGGDALNSPCRGMSRRGGRLPASDRAEAPHSARERLEATQSRGVTRVRVKGRRHDVTLLGVAIALAAGLVAGLNATPTHGRLQTVHLQTHVRPQVGPLPAGSAG